MIEQLGIAIFGVTAIWLSQDADRDVRKWSCVCGLIGQPFWFYSAYQAHQWGVFILCVFYTVAWCKGIVSNWLVDKSVNSLYK